MPEGEFAGLPRPFAECSIAINSDLEMNRDDLRQLENIENEVADNLEVIINDKFQEEFDRTPIESVNPTARQSRVFRFNVTTDLRLLADSMEDIILESIRSEVNRVIDGRASQHGYQIVV